jgi:hypothetical protein
MELYDGRDESLEREVIDGVTIFRWRGPQTANEGLAAARFDPAADLLTMFPGCRVHEERGPAPSSRRVT